MGNIGYKYLRDAVYKIKNLELLAASLVCCANRSSATGSGEVEEKETQTDTC